MTVSTAGAVTGRITAGGTEGVFKGVLKRDGTVVFSDGLEKWAFRKRQGRILTELGDLVLRVREGDPAMVVGELQAPNGARVMAGVEAEKHVYSAAKVLQPGMRRVPEAVLNVVYENGRYTALFEPLVDEGAQTNGGLERSAFPQGAGFGWMTVSDAGVVRVVGRLADGAPLSYTNRLSPTLCLAVYAPLYRGRGFLTGSVQFDPSQAGTDAACEAMDWVRPVGWSAPYGAGWPGGIKVGLAASKYIAPARPTAAMPAPANPYGVFGPGVAVNMVADAVPNFVSVELALVGGGLEREAVLAARLSGANMLTLDGEIPSGSPFLGARWGFSAKDGGFQGTFVHPKNRKIVPFAGVTLQKSRRAAGSFVFLPESGEGSSVGMVEAVLP